MKPGFGTRKLPSAPTAKQLEGISGEDQALAHLQQHGLMLITRNFCCKTGEIDLIMREQQTLVFVEVRKRAPGSLVSSLESITPAKQRRLWRTAQFYLQRFASPPACRIDVVAIDGDQVVWIKNAIQG